MNMMHAPIPVQQDEPTDHASRDAVNAVTRELAPLGYAIVDLAAFIDGIEIAAKTNLEDIEILRHANGQIEDALQNVVDGIGEISDTVTETRDAAATRVDAISENVDRFRQMAEWGSDLSTRTDALDMLQADINRSNSEIAQIARQVNILAVNASIEAARAGEAGRGFAIVADAINALSRKTAEAAAGITNSVASLQDWSDKMRADAETLTPVFKQGTDGANETHAAIRTIADDMDRIGAQIDMLDQATAELRHGSNRAKPAHDRVDAAARAAVDAASEARGRSDMMMDACEGLLQHAVEIGDGGPDAPFIAYMRDLAGQVSAAFEAGLSSGDISEGALFDFSYAPIPHTNPQQHRTRYAPFTDQAVQTLIDDALTFDPAVLFCCPCDINGFIATHNSKFSAEQTADPSWNATYSRNRRFFNDRTGLKAGRSTAPFLVQVYRRNMGGEGHVMMKDLSVPIIVRGRHWGALRMGYRDADL